MSPQSAGPAETHPPILVIGVGNEVRGDDAAGLRVARALRAMCPPEVAITETSSHAPALMEVWGSARCVLLVDAACSGSQVGTLHRFEAHTKRLPEVFGTRVSSHGLSIADAIELARALRQLPPRLIVYGIEGAGFDVGAVMSSEVAEACDRAVQLLLHDIEEMRAG